LTAWQDGGDVAAHGVGRPLRPLKATSRGSFAGLMAGDTAALISAELGLP
jgi:hypothetical protein